MTDVYDALRAVVAAWAESHGYGAASDGFSFDRQPHAEQSAFYVDPPRLRIEGYIGAGALVTGEFAIWLARAAGTRAEIKAGRLAADLGALAAVLARADLGPDTNIHEEFEIDVQPRAASGVTVIGVLRLVADWDQE